MKIALYIEDGLEQIVLTPQTKSEKDILHRLTDGKRSLSIKTGSFYHCRGGWTRQGLGDESTILVITEEERRPEDNYTPYKTPYPGEAAEEVS